MDIMETFTVNVTGGHWGLPVGAIAICASVITLIVNIAFAVAVFRDDAAARPSRPASRKPIFVGSHHLAFGDTHRWRVCGGYLLDYAPFTPESINPHNPTGR